MSKRKEQKRRNTPEQGHAACVCVCHRWGLLNNTPPHPLCLVPDPHTHTHTPLLPYHTRTRFRHTERNNWPRSYNERSRQEDKKSDKKRSTAKERSATNHKNTPNMLSSGKYPGARRLTRTWGSHNTTLGHMWRTCNRRARCQSRRPQKKTKKNKKYAGGKNTKQTRYKCNKERHT